MQELIMPLDEKSSTIRLKQKTKNLLNSLAKGKETHEEIILRLIKIMSYLNAENSTVLLAKNNLIGTKYSRLHKTIDVDLNGQKYSVVCTFNDLSIFVLMRFNALKNFATKLPLVWRLDLEIVNVKQGSSWIKPSNLDQELLRNIYFLTLKYLLEFIFDVDFYNFSSLTDYLNVDNWIDAYTKYNLSLDSLQADIRRKLV